MSTTVQSTLNAVAIDGERPERPYVTQATQTEASAQQVTYDGALMDALTAVERLFRLGAEQARAEGRDPAEFCCTGLTAIVSMAPDLYARFTDPEQALEDLAADHDIEIRRTTTISLTQAWLFQDDPLFLVPASLPPTAALTQLRAALAERTQA
ncbi:hypothetical protein ACQ86D_26320 [Streptomyces galilaeus]